VKVTCATSGRSSSQRRHAIVQEDNNTELAVKGRRSRLNAVVEGGKETEQYQRDGDGQAGHGGEEEMGVERADPLGHQIDETGSELHGESYLL